MQTLNPAFYEIALSKSLQNLGLETLDLHYIHIPEISRAGMEELLEFALSGVDHVIVGSKSVEHIQEILEASTANSNTGHNQSEL